MIDEVLVNASTLVDDLYSVSQGPAALAALSTDQAAPTVVDLSQVTSADQRYKVPTSNSGLRFRIDTGEIYQFQASGNPRINDASRGVFGYRSFDADGLEIEVLHVGKHGFATDTTLAATLSAGDTSLLITDASGWSNEIGNSAESRSLAWYGYANSMGEIYADYTYTRNVAVDFENGLWAAGEIWFDRQVGAYRVPLNAPWDGPTVDAGTAVRNATSGPTLSEPFPHSLINASERWEPNDVVIAGQWIDGGRDDFAFRPGTEFIEPQTVSAVLWNEIVFGPQQDFGPQVPTLINGTANRFTIQLDVLEKGVTEFTGDFNGDGNIDAADYTVWRDAMASGEALAADANNDGDIDTLDYNIWRENFGAASNIDLDSATAQYGTVSIVVSGGRMMVEYQSEPYFVGTDIVEYTLRDTTTGETFTSHVKVTAPGSNFKQDAAVVATLAAQAAVPDNEAPTIQRGFDFEPTYLVMAGEILVADEDYRYSLTDAFIDSEDQVVINLLSGPSHGTLKLNFDGTFQYTPKEGFSGLDTFHYEGFDGVNRVRNVATIRVAATADEFDELRLREVTLAMLNYESAARRFPIDDNSEYFDENGEPYLSWRVHVLRFTPYSDLFDQFHLDEPWDSPNNLPLLAQMPDFYRSAGDSLSSTTTTLQTFHGNGAPFGFQNGDLDQVGPRLNQFGDSPQHTILLAQAGADVAVPWTKPEDMSFNPADPLASLGTLTGGEINVATADGAVLSLSASINPADFAALVTFNGNEVVDINTLVREHEQSLGLAITPLDEAEQINSLRDIVLAALNYSDSTRSHFKTFS